MYKHHNKANELKNVWIAPGEVKIPDFIIFGAMKSGTTTLHYILNQHPNIYMPEREIHFFDIDNLFEHPDFFSFNQKKWTSQNIDEDPKKFWNWYSQHFSSAKEGQLVGEDSSVYLSSEKAAQRISLQKKDIKIIIILRHPTSRAYSQYWHMLRSGRATYRFEQMIQYDPYSILGRSMYYEQLQKVLKYIPIEQVKIVVFKEFISDKRRILKAICEHIGADYSLLPEIAFKSHKNSARIPKYLNVQILRNKLMRQVETISYDAFLPVEHVKHKPNLNIANVINKVHRFVNPLLDVRPPKIKPSTKQFLDDFFKKELAGLNELAGQDILSLWFD